MAWSRFGQERYGAPPSEVYTFPNSSGQMECCACPLASHGRFVTTHVDAFVAHLAEHRAAGHDVPPGLEDTIRTEAPEYL